MGPHTLGFVGYSQQFLSFGDFLTILVFVLLFLRGSPVIKRLFDSNDNRFQGCTFDFGFVVLSGHGL